MWRSIKADASPPHEHPTYIVDGIVHYAVANMPGGLPMTATLALTNATLPYVLQLANRGYQHALKASPALLQGLNIFHGIITHKKVAEAFGLAYHPAEACIE
jgi:alanine dehydrogenase